MTRHSSKIHILCIVVSFMVVLSSCLNAPKGVFYPDEVTRSNNYNNTIFCTGIFPERGTVIIGDTLIFNYTGEGGGDTINYGTYKIDSFGCKRVDWDGVRFSGVAGGLHSFQVFKDTLLVHPRNYVTDYEYSLTESKGKIYKYDPDSNSVDVFSELENAERNKYLYYLIVDDVFYVFSKDKIFVSKDGVHVEEIFSDNKDIDGNPWDDRRDPWDDPWDGIGICGNKLMYVSKDGFIKEYDYSSKRYTFEESLKKHGLERKNEGHDEEYYCLYCDDKKILICSDFDFFRTKVVSVSDGFSELYSRNASTSGGDGFNAINQYVFLSSGEEGLDVIDTKSGEVKKLVEENTGSVFTFGDKWIYYVGQGGALYRITYDGETKEKVFG